MPFSFLEGLPGRKAQIPGIRITACPGRRKSRLFHLPPIPEENQNEIAAPQETTKFATIPGSVARRPAALFTVVVLPSPACGKQKQDGHIQ
jgi:hypothetical protein